MKSRDGRTKDLFFHWLTEQYGIQWDDWRSLATEWFAQLDSGLEGHRKNATWFLEKYLVSQNMPAAPEIFLAQDTVRPDLFRCVEAVLEPNNAPRRHNDIVDFIDWIIASKFTANHSDGKLITEISNPFKKVKYTNSNFYETVRNPLPYSYIQELRRIMCPKPMGNFDDWVWAQQQTGQKRGVIGDWFQVPESLINADDPDCCWRSRDIPTYMPDSPVITGHKKVYEIWSPVRSMMIYVKLHLPLRLYQVRMLDSGESDTWRYSYGNWELNTQHAFARGTKKAPHQRGVFRKIRIPDTGEWSTGLYINTNKTADQNKSSSDCGYTIPWQHDEMLYWLEKLRSWQENYNPIPQVTQWSSLEHKHTGGIKSEDFLKRMGGSTFLFRHASAVDEEDRSKPIPTNMGNMLWYKLLSHLEDRLFNRGEKLTSGERLRLVKEYSLWSKNKVATDFPLHSLRVSLLTHYAMDGQVPLPILSKLLAGHSRLIMTLYYLKLSPSVMREKMAEAEQRMAENSEKHLKTFLRDAEYEQISSCCAFNDKDSIEAALINRNPVGWQERHIGLCLAGGNTVRSDEVKTLIGCWNGGELLTSCGNAGNVHSSVPHGPENCCRCRWFITSANYLDALKRHFNSLSYQASLAANLAVEQEQQVEILEDERSEAETEDKPFTKLAELQQAQHRYEKQLVEADEYAKDLRACFTLIHRIVTVEMGRQDEEIQQKLVAVGTLDDIQQPISLLETESELLQLSGVCEDAEIYPELADELRKTPAIEKRSRALDTVLMQEGYQPVFMVMDDLMQLMAGNALMRAMAQQANQDDWEFDGLKRVCGLIETGRSLSEYGLLASGLKALQASWEKPVVLLKELLPSPNSTPLKLVQNNG